MSQGLTYSDLSISFDLEKSYDTTQKIGISRNLFNMGLKHRMISFLFLFSTDKEFKIQVQVNSNLTDTFEQEMGAVQGLFFHYIKTTTTMSYPKRQKWEQF